MLNKKNPSRSDFPKAVDLLTASLAIALLLMTAGVAKALDPIANWPDLKALLHSRADSKAVTLSRGASLVLNASNAVLAPELSLLQVDPVNDPTVVVPANGVLTFAVDVTEPMYVTGAVSIGADPADLRPGLRAYILSDTTVVGAPMIYQEVAPGEMPDNIAPLRTWRLEPGRHYISIAGPHYRATGTFESIKLVGLAGTPKTPEYTFAQFTDTHVGQRAATVPQLGNTLDTLRLEGVFFAIVTGDMTNTATASEFNSFSSAITAGNGLQVYGVIGNHDAYVSSARPDALAIPGLFPTGSTNYTFSQGPVRFIVVDAAYWKKANGEYVDYHFSDYVGLGMGPDGIQWFTDTLAADTTTPTVVVAHFPFLSNLGAELLPIIKAAPNVIATLSGHTHVNNVEVWQNDYGDDITSHHGLPFTSWPGGYKVFRVYLDGDNVRFEWETRLVDNMGYVATAGTKLESSPSKSWKISTAYGRDLVSEPAGMALPGDVNGDGFVDSLDATTILGNFDMSNPSRIDGDLTGDGVVNKDDLQEVKDNWGDGLVPAEVPGETIP